MAEWVQHEHSDQIGEWMSLALDGLLGADHQRELELHLEACTTCQAQWRAMQQLSALLESSAMVGPPLGLAIRVERRLAERSQRRSLFSGMAVLTSSFSLAGVTAVIVLAVVLALAAWYLLGSQPAFQQGSSAVWQLASGLSLVGKGASLFLKDLLVQYGLPAVLLLAVSLALLSGLWAWLFRRQSDGSHRNGYA